MNKYSHFLAHDSNSAECVHNDGQQNNLDTKEHSHSHGHSHNHADLIRERGGRVILWCLIATFSFSIVEAVAGYLIHSVALESDALHMLTDAAGLAIAYFANNISKRPATIHLTFGYGKAEVVGAFINCMFTTILTIGLMVEVVQRFMQPVEIHGASLFIIASIGFLVNAVIVYVLSKNSHSLNTKAALLHALGDLLGSVVAIVAGAIIYFTNFWLIDPILSLIVIVLLIISNYSLMKRSIIILMAGVPDNLDYEQVGKDLLAIDGIVGVHDLHIWYMSANKTALSAHVIAINPENWRQVLSTCQIMLSAKHQIEHVTLQHEFDEEACLKHNCN